MEMFSDAGKKVKKRRVPDNCTIQILREGEKREGIKETERTDRATEEE